MITAMLLGFGMAGVSGLVLWESQQAEKNLRIPRIRSAMSGVEAKIRMAATKPQTYNCTTEASTTAGAVCTLTILNTDFQENFNGAKCSNSGSCGISVTAFNFVPATATQSGRIQTKISYDGQELSIKPIDVDIEVPLDLLQKNVVNCISLTSGTQPIFGGFRPDGSVICLALPGGCGVGEFISAIDPTTLKLTCGKFPNSGSCSTNEYMTQFDPMSSAPTCTSRADAFTKFGGNLNFTSTRGQVINPARPGVDSCALITTTLPPTTSPPACVPGTVTDTGCVGVGIMGTFDGCNAGTRNEPTCSAAAPTTTTSATIPNTTAVQNCPAGMAVTLYCYKICMGVNIAHINVTGYLANSVNQGGYTNQTNIISGDPARTHFHPTVNSYSFQCQNSALILQAGGPCEYHVDQPGADPDCDSYFSTTTTFQGF